MFDSCLLHSLLFLLPDKGVKLTFCSMFLRQPPLGPRPCEICCIIRVTAIGVDVLMFCKLHLG